ncbi:hypothetical protein BDN72DRAFT_883559 [Pluteus cervinus]|uniref:Uncharacterized protein n=1 Tax=Pluteus cervinus TaxID=181527 RepID=A0ACD3A4S3_9AGAR|nr:hypothetical protein BDN72DRAFT_883559 [Pluteus cervinus]
MPGRWIYELSEHLGLSMKNRRWISLQESITEVIQLYFDLSPSGPVGSKQPAALQRAMDQILEDQSHFFPPHGRPSDTKFLRNHIYERVTRLRVLARKRIQTRNNRPALRKERQNVKTGHNVRFETPNRSSGSNPTSGMALRSRHQERIDHHTTHPNAPSDPNQRAGIRPEPIQTSDVTSTQTPTAGRRLFLEFQWSEADGRHVTVSRTPSRARTSSWRPASQRISGLAVTNNVPVRISPRPSPFRRSWCEGPLSPLTELDDDEGFRTPTPMPPPASLPPGPKPPFQSRRAHAFSPTVPSRLSQTIRPSPPVQDDLFAFLEREDLSQFYPYLEAEGYDMSIIERFSQLDLQVIYSILQLAFQQQVKTGHPYHTRPKWAGRIAPPYWHMLAAKIYWLGHEVND